jgi:eukaryotic-like serine/threonine-protein kinase
VGDYRINRDVAVLCSGLMGPGCWSYVKLWDARTGRPLRTLERHTAQVDSVALSLDGRRLAPSGRDHTIRIRDLTSGQDLLTLKGHSGWVRSVAFSRDGRCLASAGDEGTVMVWGDLAANSG